MVLGIDPKSFTHKIHCRAKCRWECRHIVRSACLCPSCFQLHRTRSWWRGIEDLPCCKHFAATHEHAKAPWIGATERWTVLSSSFQLQFWCLPWNVRKTHGSIFHPKGNQADYGLSTKQCNCVHKCFCRASMSCRKRFSWGAICFGRFAWYRIHKRDTMMHKRDTVHWFQYVGFYKTDRDPLICDWISQLSIVLQFSFNLTAADRNLILSTYHCRMLILS